MNVLVVGDLHTPFTKKGYLEHCIDVYKRYNCDRVIFIGDIIDNHFSSYFESDPDGMGAGDELAMSIEMLKPWYKAFPEADVVLGNHDKLIQRKSFSSGLSNLWIKEFKDVLQTPNWNYQSNFIYNGVLYVHGENCGNLTNVILNNRMSVVIGHLHCKCEIVYNASKHDLLFGMAVGCGIDITKYAFVYQENNVKRPILSCGVVLDDGKLPILLPMNLK